MTTPDHYIARVVSLQAQERSARVELDKANIARLHAKAKGEDASQADQAYQGARQEYLAAKKRLQDLLEEIQETPID